MTWLQGDIERGEVKLLPSSNIFYPNFKSPDYLELETKEFNCGGSNIFQTINF